MLMQSIEVKYSDGFINASCQAVSANASDFPITTSTEVYSTNVNLDGLRDTSFEP